MSFILVPYSEMKVTWKLGCADICETSRHKQGSNAAVHHVPGSIVPARENPIVGKYQFFESQLISQTSAADLNFRPQPCFARVVFNNIHSVFCSFSFTFPWLNRSIPIRAGGED